MENFHNLRSREREFTIDYISNPPLSMFSLLFLPFVHSGRFSSLSAKTAGSFPDAQLSKNESHSEIMIFYHSSPLCGVNFLEMLKIFSFCLLHSRYKRMNALNHRPQWSDLIGRVGRNSDLILKLILMAQTMQITSFHVKMVQKCVKRLKNCTFWG